MQKKEKGKSERKKIESSEGEAGRRVEVKVKVEFKVELEWEGSERMLLHQ